MREAIWFEEDEKMIRCDSCLEFNKADALEEGMCIACEPTELCHTCSGTGEGIACSVRCSTCGGSGEITRTKEQ